MNLFSNQDGADPQSQAVLAYLRRKGNIEISWNPDLKTYMANPEVFRWHNCREQGYVICMRDNRNNQLNIAFFKHRNSDNICAIKWVQKTKSGNPPTIDTMTHQAYKSDKYALDKSLPVGCAYEMSEWIYQELCNYWEKST